MWSIATSISGKLLSAPPHTMSSRRDEGEHEKQYGSLQGPSQGTEVGRGREGGQENGVWIQSPGSWRKKKVI